MRFGRSSRPMTHTASRPPAASAAPLPSPHGASRAALTLGAVGVVFGDIGTSPLYALQATLDPRYHLSETITDLYGIVSLIFWSFVFVVTVKYVFIVMRCDNRGEGGSLVGDGVEDGGRGGHGGKVKAKEET